MARLRDSMSPKRPSWRSATVLGMVVALAVAAVVVDGYRSAKFELDEASVWVTNGADAIAGRINTLAGQVEVTTKPGGAGLDVVQRGRDVLVVEAGTSLTPIDAASGNPSGDPIQLAGDMDVAAGGGTVVIRSTKAGRAWIAASDDLDGVDLRKRKGTVKVPSDGQVVVGPTGAVFAVSPTQGIRHVRGPKGDVASTSLRIPTDGPLEQVVVGTTPVVLAPAAGKLQIGDRVVDVGTFGSSPRLQDGPASGSSVLVATDAELVSIPLAEGEAEVLREQAGGSDPVRPVRAGRCAFGAWGSGGTGGKPVLARACLGARSEFKEIDLTGGSANARFRVNGSYAVLNGLSDGRSYLLRESTLVVIDNWSQIRNPTPTDEVDEEDDSDGGDADCSPKAENAPPVPEDDPELGARPGSATLLDVLGNDRDADCDVLVVTEVRDITPSDGMKVQPVDRGHALQFEAPVGFSGPVQFTYLVGDGRSAPVPATAVVTVRTFEQGNEPPEQVRPAKISVGPAQTVSFDVLGSFVDPDGDPIILDGADLPAGTLGTVRSESNGTVTFTDAGSSGTFAVALRVTDGRAGALGKLDVEMVPDPSPVARNDHALGLVGEPVSVEVLANDTGVGGEELSLTKAESSEPDTAVQVDTTAGLVVFTATRAGTYRVPYSIASGAKEASAFVRFDVSEPTANVAPVAVRDTATVVVGGTTTVDLVSNDFDANLDVLVVTSVSVPSGTGLTVQLLEHRALKVSASRLPEVQPVVIDYQVTDGQSDPVAGQLQLQVITTGRVNQPPTAKDDVAVVRAGDVVTVPVLANDVDPDGDALKVLPEVSINLADGATAPGVAFAVPNAVRFVAGPEAGFVTISYQVTDGISGTASALVRLRIAPTEGNQAPVPRSLQARTLVDGPLRISVPVAGVDPDGDAVTLAIETPPSLGTVVLGEDCDACFDYTPSKGRAGTDVFTYTATDAGGLSGTATVRVGIGARGAANQPPIAVADKVQVRPGVEFAVPVLANDSDPDNDPIELVDEPIPASGGVTAEVSGERVVVTGDEEGTATFTYQVTDGKEASPGTLTVEISADAPPAPPIARDDVAEVPEDRGDPAIVDVLANDEDPDGEVSALEIEIDPTAVDRASVVDGKVQVQLGDRPTVVLYRITDTDELSAMAVIRVPSKAANLPPRLRSDLSAIKVEGGQTVTVSLADVAEDPEGDADILLVPGDNLRGDHGTVEATGPSTLSFTAEADFTGPGAVTFTATDGADPTDPAGARASLTVPFEIASTKNTPPTLTGAAATVEVAGDATTVDLRTFAADPDEGDLEQLRFESLSGFANGVTGSLNGSVLELQADETAQKNQPIRLSLTVTDGKDAPVPGSVEVTVVASRKPLATLVEQSVIASSGLAKEVRVLDGSSVPDGLGPLQVLEPQLDASLGQAVSPDGTTIVVTPNESFFGVANVTFVVQDRTKDVDRQVTGKIQVTVKDRPGKPQPPTVAEYGNQFVVLTWQPPEARGGTIEEYELKSADGSVTKVCEATTCRLTAEDRIANDTTYTFTVRARNEVTDKNDGWSDPSEPSATVRPDTRPDPSTVGPTLTYDPTLKSGELLVEFPEAGSSGPWRNFGSPILAYEVQLSPAPPNTAQLKVGPSTNSFTITGLTDGQRYKARVRAQNSANKEIDPSGAKGWSEYSPFGNEESPASTSSPPVNVKVQRRESPIASILDVSWSRPTNINATELLGYTIVVYKNGAESSRVTALQSPSLPTFLQAIRTEDSLGTDFTFRIIATNKAGDSDLSAPSPVQRAFTKPKPITGLTAAPTQQNGQVQLTFDPPDTGGTAITDYRVTASPGGATFHAYSSPGILMTGLANGTNYTFTVQACNQGRSKVDYCGDASNSAAANPYGPPGAPTVGSGRASDTSIRLSWNAPAPNGRPIDRVEISINGGGWQPRGDLSNSVVVGDGYQQTHCIVARAVSGGLTGPTSNQDCTRTADPPPTNQLTWRKGGPNPTSSYTCEVGSCNYIIAELRDFAPYSTHTVTAYWSDGPETCPELVPSVQPKRFQVDGAGNATVNTGCYAGNIGYGIVLDGNKMGTHE